MLAHGTAEEMWVDSSPPPGGKNPDGHWIESWVGPPAGLDVLGVTESEPAGIGIPDRPVRNLNAVPTTLSRLQ